MSDDALAMAQADRERLEAENAELAAYSARLREALGRIEKMPWPDSESPYALIAREVLAEPTPALVERYQAAERVADLLMNFWRAKTSEQPLVEALSAWRALRGEEAQA